jgi:hypothetical protein
MSIGCESQNDTAQNIWFLHKMLFYQLNWWRAGQNETVSTYVIEIAV